jgi:UDP-N-acetylmuramoyl-tripeptide--D-alanyl-D-alanine ligase
MDLEHIYQIFRKSTGVCTDSRVLKEGELFFALKGDNFDGNRFACKALEKGALYSIVDDKNVPSHDRIIVVDDVLKKLQELAHFHRKALDIPIIGITGTNGKTTTKELVSSVLSTKYKIAFTKGNLNNHIGVPLTLLQMDESIQIGVVEMGASAPGEIASLVEICEPDYGIVTSVGKAHLQGFGSLEGVKKTKGELYDFLKKHGGVIFFNADNPDIYAMVKEREPVSCFPYGLRFDNAEILPVTIDNPFLKIKLKTGKIVETRLIGSYNADNVMAALAVGKHFFIDLDASIEAIKNYLPTNNRSQLTKGKYNRLIVDAYNANPTSMRAALQSFQDLNADHAALILGDMLELGEDSQKEHREILKIVSDMNVEKLFFVGNEFARALPSFKELSLKSKIFPTSSELRNYLLSNPLAGYTILIKGSRGIAVEKVIDAL